LALVGCDRSGVPSRLHVYVAPTLAKFAASHPPIELCPGETLTDVERGVRALLRDVDYFASLTPQDKRLPHFVERREKLARNLLALREVLG